MATQNNVTVATALLPAKELFSRKVAILNINNSINYFVNSTSILDEKDW